MSLFSFHDILRRLKDRYPNLDARIEESEVVELWEACVGPTIAKHAKVIKVDQGELYIEVDHPTWKSELHFRKAQILEKLRNTGKNFQPTDLFLVEKKVRRNEPNSNRYARGNFKGRPKT